MKPSCRRCVLLLNKCVYPSVPQFIVVGDRGVTTSEPNSSSSVTSNSPIARSLSVEASTCSNATSVDLGDYFDETKPLAEPSDTDLYHHYLQHTSRTLSHSRRDQSGLQIGIPTLALHSKTVFHSLLAISAACMACDIICKDPIPDVNTVSRILMTGYRHYNSASERMRESMSCPETMKPQPLLASAILLMPFAAASQQINHWISSRVETSDSYKLLSTTPRDIIVITRGLRTMLRTLNDHSSNPNNASSSEAEIAVEMPMALLDINVPPKTLPPSRTHLMMPILTATSQRAFSKLEDRLKFAFESGTKSQKKALSACYDAFLALKDIRCKAFATTDLPSTSSLNELGERSLNVESGLPLQVPPWLRSLADGSTVPLSDEPLTKFLLNYLVEVPQAYLDLVLPLLDQRLETPIGSSPTNLLVELTREQALALDIYAHWSALMFPIEDESWWIGSLPDVTLTGMVNRFGDDFVANSCLEIPLAREKWWPGGMLNIWQEIKTYR